jgi:cytochrome c oxidase cbb3-type subunit 3
MGNFSELFWNIYIILVTVGGIWALFVFVQWQSKMPPPSDETETTGHVWDEDLTELNNPLPAWWRNLFYVTLVFGIVYLILYPGLGSYDMMLRWTQVKQYEEEMADAEQRYGPIFNKFLDQDIERVAEDPDALKIGERLYASYCTGCHGSDARGVPGFPNLADGDWLYGGTPEAIETSILKGRNGVMPPWEQPLGGAQEVSEVAQYVLGLSGRKVDAAAAARGQGKFQQFCVACHGADGTGNPGVGAPNLTNGIWLYGGSPKAVEASIAGGRQGRMPPHEEFLGKAKVHLLAAYIYSLSR